MINLKSIYKLFSFTIITLLFAYFMTNILWAQELDWVKRAGGLYPDGGVSIDVLSDSSTLITGYFDTSATFGPGEPGQTVLTSAGDDDIFVAKYNPDGTLAWVKQAGGSEDDSGSSISALSDGSSIVAGGFRDTATFGPGEPGQTVLTASSQSDLFIAKYNTDGTLAWAKRAGGSDYDWGTSVKVLSDGSSLVTGYFSLTATFGQGEISQTILTSAGSKDIFIAKYNSDGTLAWAKRAGGSDFDGAYCIAKLSDESSIITGVFWYTAIFGQGEPNQTILNAVDKDDIFVAKYNSDGTLAWAKSAGSIGDLEMGDSVDVLADGSSLATGEFMYTATFGAGETNETTLTSSGSTDIFIAKYNPDGTLAWAKKAGGGGLDDSCEITVFSDGCSAVTGAFPGTITFGEGEPNQTILTSDDIYHDIFIAQYNPNGTLIGAVRAGGNRNDWGNSITNLLDTDLFVTGVFATDATFGPGDTNQTILTSAGSWDIFVAKYTALPPTPAYTINWQLYK